MHDNEITPYQLRPPEIFIRGPWNEKVDIWTFGCLVSFPVGFASLLVLTLYFQIFELTTKRELYRYEPGRTLDSVEHMLYQMMLFTGEDFEPEQLRVSKLAAQYFDNTCTYSASLIENYATSRDSDRQSPEKTSPLSAYLREVHQKLQSHDGGGRLIYSGCHTTLPAVRP